MPYALRPAGLADAAAVTDLLNEIDRIEIGRPRPTCTPSNPI